MSVRVVIEGRDSLVDDLDRNEINYDDLYVSSVESSSNGKDFIIRSLGRLTRWYIENVPMGLQPGDTLILERFGVAR